MDHTESSSTKTKGRVDSRPVTFTYDHSEKAGERELNWSEDDRSTTRLSSQSIIAVLPINAQRPDEYSLLYAGKPPKDEQLPFPSVFTSCVATELPQAFIHDNQPLGNDCWQIRQNKGQTLHIVVSTGSGTGQALAVCEKLLKPMLKHICSLDEDDYTLHVTSSEFSVSDLTRDIFLPQANKGVAQSIILLSGDGGMVDMINAILTGQQSRDYMKPTVALSPLGTGNALANSAGINSDNTFGLKTLLQGSAKELPLFCATFSPDARLLVNQGQDEQNLNAHNGTPVAYGAVVCSWGLHASLVANSDSTEYRKFGAERFQMAAKDLLQPADGSLPHPYKGKVSVLQPLGGTKGDWQAIDRDSHGYVLATFVSQLEKGFTISPASTPLDGKLRLVHFGALSGEGAMDVMTKAYKGGQHVEDGRVGYEEIEGVRIQFDEEEEARWRRICVDGKIIQVEKEGWVEVKAGVKGVVDLIVMQ